MILTFSGVVQAVDSGERRIIAGKIAPYGEVGNTSVGRVVFAKGSITAANPDKIKLLMSHDNTKPVGRMKTINSAEDGLYASFKVSSSTRGNDAILLAQEQLMDGLSVGVEVTASEPKDNYLLVTAAVLREVSLVESAAFTSAAVQSIAAQLGDPMMNAATTQSTKVTTTSTTINSTTTETETETESEAAVTTAPDTNAPDAVAEATPAPAVEAARPIIRNTVTGGELRSPIKTHANYMQHMIAARLGNEESADYVRAADAKGRALTAANDSFTTNPAFNPISYMPGVIDATVFPDRPTIDALGGTQPITDTGMVISHPKITTAGSAGIIAEGGATASTQLVSSYVDATVVKIASEQIMSVELLERSGPAFYDAMFKNISKAYARACNAAAIAEIVSGGTQASTQAATIAGIQAYIAQAGPAVYSGSKELPEVLIAGVSVWSLLIGSLDTTGRPLFTALNPYNATGKSSSRSLRGDVMGLDLWVDAGMVATTIDDCAFIGNASSIAMYESPKLTMQTTLTGTGEVKTLLYGYFAVKTLIATGLQRFNLT